ncbi:hypothetical protein [Tolypothrix sp. FACHB-123]|nr:hypothetical protein [Tolypothrix sp. FACHB-123]
MPEALRCAIANPKSKIELPNAPCPMPNAQCPIPNYKGDNA